MNILSRLRLAYCTLLNKGGREYAVIYLSLIVCIFIIGCWSLLGLVVPYSFTNIPFYVWAFVWIVSSVGITYVTCIWRQGYKSTSDLLSANSGGIRRRVEVKNGLLLVIGSIFPQVLALGIMLLK